MDAYDAVAELNFILRIFGLHNIHQTSTLTVAKWPYLKISFILFCFGVMLFYNIYYHFCSQLLLPVNLTVKTMDTISIIVGYLYYLIDLYFVFKYAGESFIAYCETYEQIDKYFEIKYHKDIRRNVRNSIAMFLTLWFLSSASDYAAWCFCFEWQSPTSYTVVYFAFLIRTLTVLELNSHSMFIGYRLKTIADVLKDHYPSTPDVPSRIKVVTNSKVLIKNKARIVPVTIREESEIARLSSYYLVLSRQAIFLNNFFGVRILLHCLYTLLEIISYVNLMDRILVGSVYKPYHIGYYPAATSLLRLVACATLLASLVHRCEQSSRQSGHVIDAIDYLLVNKKITSSILRLVACATLLASFVHRCEQSSRQSGHVIDAIDHLLVNKERSSETQASLQQLRGLVSTRPIRFHAANFFNLDSNLLLSTASVVATYAVILIQSTI